jgi:iron-sulfur cluster assembly accessory protein
MISITPAAAEHLNSLVSGREEAPDGLRILVEKGGCAGMQYAMKLDTSAPEDLTIERDGARVFMDPATASLLRGAQLDYCDDLVGTGFRLQNPNAARSCGCGTSFEPAEPAEPLDTGFSAPLESTASRAP